MFGAEVRFIATREIEAGEELLWDYRSTIKFEALATSRSILFCIDPYFLKSTWACVARRLQNEYWLCCVRFGLIKTLLSSLSDIRSITRRLKQFLFY